MSVSGTPAGLSIEQLRVGGGCILKLSGVIDENFDTNRFVTGVEGVVVVDLDNVKRITSYGVREWMAALQRLKCSWLGFIRCRPAMVAQFNMVTAFAGPGKLVSMYLPYVSSASGQTFEVLTDIRRHHAELTTLTPPPVNAPDTGQAAEFDDIPESYFSYVASQPPPDVPPIADQLISGHATAEGTGPGLRLIKEVLGTVTGLWLLGRLDAKDHFRRIADGIEGRLYVSGAGIHSVSEEGISKLLKFLRDVNAKIVLDELPLGLVERIAVDSTLHSSVALRRVRLPATCSLHGKCSVAVDAATIDLAAKGSPPAHTCPQCNKPLKFELTEAVLRTVAALPSEPMGTEEIAALIAAHQARMTDVTPTKDRIVNLSSGAMVLGRYQLVRPIGAGGMAEVFLARQTAVGGFDRNVVVKRILPGLAVDSNFVEMFLQEARLAARLSHPNIAQIFDVGVDAGQYYIVMEYVRGWDLNAVLKANATMAAPCPPRIAARIAADIAAGLHAAHSYTDAMGKPQPIIHRDVSPHNVLMSIDGHVKLTDFGIAKAADSSSLTPTSLLKGKTSYMAPEQIRSARTPPDPRADIFAAGLIFYQLLTRLHPFRRNTELATFKALMQEKAAPPSQLVRGIPQKLDIISARAMASEPADRYATASAFENDLADFIVSTGASVSAADVSRWIADQPLKGEADAPAKSAADVATVASDATPSTKR
nr:serine/threonine-protein kinase PknD [uncultured bacterium]